MMEFSAKAFKILMVTLLVYALLVATHRGEFWPFSIYPMFSQAGNPWTRALVQDVSQTPDSLMWQPSGLDDTQGAVLALTQTGVDQIDFSNFVSKTNDWTDGRQKALITMFGKKNIGESRWMVSKVNGHLTPDDSVVVEVVPFLMVTRDTVLRNPNLPDKAYSPE
jgi:hypothetical protein